MLTLRVWSLFLSLLGLVGLAKADVTSATAAITAAQGDATTVISALTAMGIAIWAAYFIYQKFFNKK